MATERLLQKYRAFVPIELQPYDSKETIAVFVKPRYMDVLLPSIRHAELRRQTRRSAVDRRYVLLKIQAALDGQLPGDNRVKPAAITSDVVQGVYRALTYTPGYGPAAQRNLINAAKLVFAAINHKLGEIHNPIRPIRKKLHRLHLTDQEFDCLKRAADAARVDCKRRLQATQDRMQTYANGRTRHGPIIPTLLLVYCQEHLGFPIQPRDLKHHPTWLKHAVKRHFGTVHDLNKLICITVDDVITYLLSIALRCCTNPSPAYALCINAAVVLANGENALVSQKRRGRGELFLHATGPRAGRELHQIVSEFKLLSDPLRKQVPSGQRDRLWICILRSNSRGPLIKALSETAPFDFVNGLFAWLDARELPKALGVHLFSKLRRRALQNAYRSGGRGFLGIQAAGEMASHNGHVLQPEYIPALVGFRRRIEVMATVHSKLLRAARRHRIPGPGNEIRNIRKPFKWRNRR